MWQLLIPFAKDLIERFIPSPTEKIEAQKALAALEMQVREAEAKAEAARAEEFARYIEATQPKSDHVYVLANTLIALVRPGLALFAVISPILWTEQWIAFLKALEGAGMWGAIALVPVWAWVLGRDGVRMILGIVAGRKGVDVNIEALREALPPGLPPAPVHKPAPSQPEAEKALPPGIPETPKRSVPRPFTSDTEFRKDPPDREDRFR